MEEDNEALIVAVWVDGSRFHHGWVLASLPAEHGGCRKLAFLREL